MMGPSNDNSHRVPANRPYVDVRPTRRVRLIDHGGSVIAYPEPHRTPVLPSGWAPLTREQQDAVLHACNAAPRCVVFRIGSLWDPDAEYRVYRLTDQRWAGLWVACRYVTTVREDPASPIGENRQLLGLGTDGLAYAVPMPRPPLEGLKDQQVKRPLQKFDAVLVRRHVESLHAWM